MKYFFISDVHGEYDKMKKALEEANFNAATDTLVSLGDPFDRGDKSLEVLEFIMSCPNRIIVWGNHDGRLMQLLFNNDDANPYDYINGVPETLKSFTNNYIDYIEEGISKFMNSRRFYKTRELLMQYFNEAVFALEWDDLIATHGWLPITYGEFKKNKKGNLIRPMKLNEEWRNSDKNDFYNATWANTEKCIKNNMFPEKKLLVGHWHAHRIHMLFNPELTDAVAPFTTFQNEKLIAIDGCTNDERGLVNVYIYESDSKPICYKE